jgi:putative ABC transport system ATP-binding protein
VSIQGHRSPVPEIASSPGIALDGSRSPPTGPLVRLDDVWKVFRTGRVEYAALRGVGLAVQPGELVAIVGPSGSGKSTLLNVITGIDRPTSGSVVVAGVDLVGMSEDDLAGFRGARVGIVFQFFQLLPTLTALENTMLPMEFARRGHVREHALAARERLGLVGLADKGDRFPSELSGGEQQRVAIARALALDPVLLVADEPTGNLDTDTAGEILSVFERLNRGGTTIVFVTHDPALTAHARRVAIRDGVVDDAGP